MKKYFKRLTTVETRTVVPGRASLMDQVAQTDIATTRAERSSKHCLVRLTKIYPEKKERDDKNPPLAAIDNKCSVDLDVSNEKAGMSRQTVSYK